MLHVLPFIKYTAQNIYFSTFLSKSHDFITTYLAVTKRSVSHNHTKVVLLHEFTFGDFFFQFVESIIKWLTKAQNTGALKTYLWIPTRVMLLYHYGLMSSQEPQLIFPHIGLKGNGGTLHPLLTSRCNKPLTPLPVFNKLQIHR